MNWTALCVVAGAVALAGCGGDEDSTSSTPPARTVDTAAVESGIKQQLSTTDNKVTKVKCPDDVQAEVGKSFNCTVTWANGATGKVKVTETSVNQYRYAPVAGSVMVPGTVVEESLEQDLAQQGLPNAAVNCPDNIIIKVGTTVTCDLSGAGAKGTVTYTFSDASGEVDSSSVKTE